jgi:hypothetical protein
VYLLRIVGHDLFVQRTFFYVFEWALGEKITTVLFQAIYLILANAKNEFHKCFNDLFVGQPLRMQFCSTESKSLDFFAF